MRACGLYGLSCCWDFLVSMLYNLSKISAISVLRCVGAENRDCYIDYIYRGHTKHETRKRYSMYTTTEKTRVHSCLLNSTMYLVFVFILNLRLGK